MAGPVHGSRVAAAADLAAGVAKEGRHASVSARVRVPPMRPRVGVSVRVCALNVTARVSLRARVCVGVGGVRRRCSLR